MMLMLIVVGGWIVMELADMTSRSLLERPDLLYIVRRKIHARHNAVLQ